MADRNTVLMEGVRIIFRNFQGEEKRFNKKGERNFGVILPPEQPQLPDQMLADGWPVKYLNPREEDLAEDPDAQPVAWLPVKVAYDKGRPPKIVMITSRGPTILNENTVANLDVADIQNVDLIVSPYSWTIPGDSGRSGISIYVQSMFVTVEEDELEKKYAELLGQAMEADENEDDVPQ